MAEQNNQQQQNQQQQQEPHTFTQAELNSIVESRLAQERKKYADYDTLKDKAGKYDAQQNAGKTDIQKANDAIAALTQKLDAMTKERTEAEMKTKVSKETGVPAELLTGADEEACKAQAAAILKFAKPNSYPGTKKNTSNAGGSASSSDEAMRQFAKQIFKKGE